MSEGVFLLNNLFILDVILGVLLYFNENVCIYIWFLLFNYIF